MTPREMRCETCVFGRRCLAGELARECWRYPPDTAGARPRVSDDHWCGEWQPRPGRNGVEMEHAMAGADCLMTCEQAAHRLSISVPYVRRLVKAGELSAIRRGTGALLL